MLPSPMPTLPTTLTVGTRTSALALWQTHYVIDALQAAWPGLSCEITPFVTQGDKTQAAGKPLPSIGGKGVFTLELETALHSGAIDLAVHSLKDLPVEDAPGLTVGAISQRADVRDVLVARNSWTLATLPVGAVVGTSSTRRAAQLLLARPDLTIKSIRGNVGTRIGKVTHGEYDATVLAAAGLERLGLVDAITEWLSLDIMLPAPGQGALGVQCRADDPVTRALLAVIDHAATRAAVTAERQFLHELGGGCSAPVAAYATTTTNPDRLNMATFVASPDGQRVVRVQGEGDAPTVGRQLAQQALAQGVASLLNTPPTLAQLAPLPGQAAPEISGLEISKPLNGKRVVVTRAREQASALCAQLAEVGATPLLIPMIQIVPLPDQTSLDQAIQTLATYDWVIFTSTNTVAIFWERWLALTMNGQALNGHAFPAKVQVAAVGTATAESLRQRGIEPAFVPTEFVAEKIADGLGARTGARILLPQAMIARHTLAELLRAQGAHVDALAIYQTLPVALEPTALSELQQGVDVIVFTSPSTVHNFMDALRQQPFAQAVLQNSRIVCIGPVTAQAAQTFALPVATVADEYSAIGVVNALVDYFQKERS